MAGHFHYNPVPSLSLTAGPSRAGIRSMNLSFALDAFVNEMSGFQTPAITDPSQCNPRANAATLKMFDFLHESNQIRRVLVRRRRAERGSTAAEGMWIDQWRATL